MYVFNGHDDEQDIAELVESCRQDHRERRRAGSVAQSVEHNVNTFAANTTWHESYSLSIEIPLGEVG
ncbi:MAG: hypothetical protein ACKPKO_35150 [Candidatus Fonsibacter sp.]